MGATEDAIDAAIVEHCRAEEYTGVITGWVVLVSTLDHDGEDERSGVTTIYPNGSMPWPHALGIVEAGRLRMHALFVGGDA